MNLAAQTQAKVAPIPAPSPAPSQSQLLQRKCACEDTPGADGECEECRSQRLTLQRRSTAPAAPTPPAAPSIVHEVLNTPGQPLDADTRAFMGSKFGHDFSRVRVHTDARAAESARAVNALAYTVGRDMVFGAGQYAPGTIEGKKLMAHELTHVLQQKGATGAVQSKLPINTWGDAGEREADDVAERLFSDEVSTIKQNSLTSKIQRISANKLIEAPEVGRVNGIVAHNAIIEDFKQQVGNDAFPFKSIPNATWAEHRMECGDEPPSTSINQPRPDPDNPYPIYGYPDLVLQAEKDAAELAEIKPAHVTCVPEGEAQVRHYIRIGNNDKKWLQRQNLRRLNLMSTSRYTVPSDPLPVPGYETPITLAWYANGLLLYKAIEEKNTEVFVCGTKDRGKINKFLNSALGRAQRAVDKYINDFIDPLLTKVINSISIKEALEKVLGHRHGSDLIADEIEKKFKDLIEKELRKFVMNLKDRVLTRVRQKLQEQLLSYLEKSLNALCAAAASGVITITINDLLKQLEKDMPGYFAPVFVSVIQEVVYELLAEIGKAIKEAIEQSLALKILAAIVLAAVAAIVIVAIIASIPEDIIIAVGAAIAALGTAIWEWLSELIKSPIFGT